MISGNKVRLFDKSLANTPDNYAWQTDLELAQLDAALPLTISFTEYLLNCAGELRHPPPAKRQFAIKTPDGKHIGNCTYYNINERAGEAELGITLGNRDYWGKGYGTDAITTLLSHIFRKTNLKRIYLKTLESNRRAQKCFNKCGFTPYGHRVKDGHGFVLMELYRTKWQQQREKPVMSCHRGSEKPLSL